MSDISYKRNFTYLSIINIKYKDIQLLVSCGGRGQWMGCVSSHVHTIRLLMWDTLENFTAILTSYVG
jgi:hypothetical protein